MNKKSTLLAAALMAVSSLTVKAADTTVGPEQGVAGNYYYLKSDGNYLTLCGTKADSVIVKDLLGTTKAAKDSALWEITKVGTETGGNPIYQFKNKKTKAILSFEKSETAKPILAEGINQWSFTGKKIVAYWNNDKSLALSVSNKKLVLGKTTSDFEVVLPEKSVAMKAADLGENFSVFQLSFDNTYEGDLFSGKDIIARDITGKADFVTLQIKGDESFSDGTPKYLGLDTTKFDITNATNVFGAKFALDSTYKQQVGLHTVGNEAYQQFKFLIDLKNDSLAMFVADAPVVNGDLANFGKVVRVVYIKADDKQLLTVSEKDENKDNAPLNGAAPLITVKKGTPAVIATGSGVYFLKSASKTATGGKYISAYKAGEIETMTGTPSVNQLEGQWYIKEEGGMYSVVDRKGNTDMMLKGEVFAVQGMENTFTFGSNADSITVEAQKVNLDDKYLGSRHFTKDEIANNGYVLNLISAGSETSKTYAFTSDSILKVTSGEAADAVVFKLEPVETKAVGGAQVLKDTVFAVTYKLKSRFSDKYVAYDKTKASLKVSDYDSALEFNFNTNVDGGKYDMKVVSGDAADKFVDAHVSSSNMVLSQTPAYFNFVEMDAPEYGTFESSHRRFTSELKSLTMNPLNFFAEAKQEGQEITRANYEKDNFCLWLMKSDASTADRPLYFITTALAVDGVPGVDQIRYYMVSGNDSTYVGPDDKHRVLFTPNDTLETMKDNTLNPALWALKVTESGNYLLENQKDVTVDKSNRYIGIINSFVVMSNSGAEFTVESTPGPVANEEIEAASGVQVIGGVGEFSIRNASGKRITVSNILGQAVTSRYATSDYETIPTVRGVVIVSVEGDKAYKVIVK